MQCCNTEKKRVSTAVMNKNPHQPNPQQMLTYQLLTTINYCTTTVAVAIVEWITHL